MYCAKIAALFENGCSNSHYKLLIDQQLKKNKFNVGVFSGHLLMSRYRFAKLLV